MAEGERFEHGSVLGGKTRADWVSSQWKSTLKALMPEDAKEAFGHGVRAKGSKSGAISFELLRNQFLVSQ